MMLRGMYPNYKLVWLKVHIENDTAILTFAGSGIEKIPAVKALQLIENQEALNLETLQ